ncbi:putative tetratricopeptide-like helical domain, DYW domain-containing protein [Rosa chinensis]|uniref:Putative tetratricopeptide-like helical domain, DYW domain-containing protein n=1 Tax=Rosa chinensis TaxID=74649 RepID=A0A2P6PCB9_ROSCH|nr:putative tetratricopeptide-like helical domain, DYW domain-containing protein [Rosa chinensis]
MSVLHLDSLLCKISNVSQLRQLHAHLIQNSLHHQNQWVSLLINQCTRLRAPPPYTRLIFDSTPRPNIHVFTSMLKYYAPLGNVCSNQVVSLYQLMQRCEDVCLGTFVYPVLIKSSGSAGIAFHAHVVKLGLGSDHYVSNAIMSVYSKYGPVEHARDVFDEMPERSLVDWNNMISGYWKWGNKVEACKLFDMMPEKSVVTWTAMVTGYARMKDLENARRYFDNIPEKNVVSWNAMLSAYAQNGSPEEALRLFDGMMDSGDKPNETTWAIVISACSSCGNSSIADSFIQKLNQKRMHLSYFGKTAMLDMYAKRGSIKKLFDKMPERDVVSWNSMISGYAQNGQSALAIDLFKDMTAADNPKPNEVTMVSVISACGHLGALEIGNWAVNFLTKHHTNLSISVYNSLIFLYSKCGNMDDAKRIFNEMKQRDVVSYNTLISGFAAHGHGMEAVKLKMKMKEEFIEPNRETYIGILTACSHAGLLEEGWKIFESIKDPDVDHYACVVDLLGRVGKVDEAKKIVDGMQKEPHAGVYGSILNASRIHKRIDLGEFAASKLFELEPHNSGNYILLSNIYASAGRWDDVVRVREAMRNAGVKKATGWSWVEYNGKMHKFIAGDRSHELSDEIYTRLAELGRKLRNAGYIADKACVLRDVDEEEKEEMVGTHSEKLAVCFALLVTEAKSVIRVVKNLRVCRDCHTAIKMISKLEGRKIILRDNNRFHHFSDGQCSCGDYW